MYSTYLHSICTNYTATCVNGGLWQSSCTKGSQLFTTNGTFYPLPGVTIVRVFLIGGGGGGTCGNFPGGSGGYVSCGSVNLSGKTNVNVIVGDGGQPSSGAESIGGTSSLGSIITALGGRAASADGCFLHNGADGGTGSGYSTVVHN